MIIVPIGAFNACPFPCSETTLIGFCVEHFSRKPLPFVQSRYAQQSVSFHEDGNFQMIWNSIYSP